MVTEAKFLHNCFWHNLIGIGNNRKVVHFTFMQKLLSNS